MVQNGAERKQEASETTNVSKQRKEVVDRAADDVYVAVNIVDELQSCIPVLCTGAS